MQSVVDELIKGGKKVDKYSLNEVKTVFDDSLRKVMNEGVGSAEVHTHMNIKLLLGYPAAILGGIVGYCHLKVPFNECKELVGICVALYCVFNSLLSLYIWFVEKDVVYVGTKGSKKIVITSKVKNYDADYKLSCTISAVGAASGKSQKPATHTLVKSVGEWLDVEGTLCADKFVQELAAFITKSKF